jgi:hypothetical protein
MKLIPRTLVLHPYYKFTYIDLAWGGEVEQAAERDAGNPNAKNWQDEAKKVVENEVSKFFFLKCSSLNNYYTTIDRWKNIGRISRNRHHLQDRGQDRGQTTLGQQVAMLDQHRYCQITIDTALLFCLQSNVHVRDGRQSCAVMRRTCLKMSLLRLML